MNHLNRFELAELQQNVEMVCRWGPRLLEELLVQVGTVTGTTAAIADTFAEFRRTRAAKVRSRHLSRLDVEGKDQDPRGHAAMRMGDEAVHDLDALPARVTRKEAAAIICQHFFHVAARSLERWPLDVVVVNRTAQVLTASVISEARRRLAAAIAERDGA